MKLCQKRLCQGLSAICLLSSAATSMFAQPKGSVDEPRSPSVLCDANPLTIDPEGSATITAKGTSPENRPLTYSFTATTGEVSGNGSSALFKAIRVAPGPLVITCTVADDHGRHASDTVRLNVTRGD